MLNPTEPKPGEPQTEHLGERVSSNAEAASAPPVASAMPPAQTAHHSLPGAGLVEAKANLPLDPLEADSEPQLKADRSLKDDDILAAGRGDLASPQAAESKPPEANLSLGIPVSHVEAQPGTNRPAKNNTVAPRKLAGGASPAAGANPQIQLLQFPGGVAVDIKRDIPRDFIVVVIPAVLSIAVTVILAIVAHRINQQQAKSQEAQSLAAQEQSKAAQEEVNVRFIEEFRKHLGDLTLPEGEENLTKKTLAAITLAQYGERALPALKMSLHVEDKDIREGAAVVLAQMLLDRTLRWAVLSKLGEYFDEPNSSLRLGLLGCYVTINRKLTDAEFKEVSSKITKYVEPSADYTDKPDEKEVLLGAVKFFGNWPRVESKNFLLSVAQNNSSGDDPREGAINYLPKITICAKDLSEFQREESRQEVSTALGALLSQVPERLRKNITEGIAKLQKPREMQCS